MNQLLMMNAEQRKVYAAFEKTQGAVATQISAGDLFSLLTILGLISISLGLISLPNYLVGDAIVTSRLVGAICLAIAGFPWVLLHWGYYARKAKRYQIFKTRKAKFLDLGFATIVLANLIFWFPQSINNGWVMLAYWIMAVISNYVLFCWVWLNKPPRETL